MGGGFMNGIGGFGTFGMIGWILNLVITIGAVVGIVLLVAWFIKRLGLGAGPTDWTSLRSGAPESAREILQARYARGEITREQFREILADLS